MLSINGAPPDTEVVVTQGNVPSKLLELASRQNVDLLIFGIHGNHILPRKGLGSTANALLRLAKFPVILYPASLERA
jgi:nucleotide-binding universal stress UspA family protein